eukprot:1812421-Prymnesium_polylepis.1
MSALRRLYFYLVGRVLSRRGRHGVCREVCREGALHHSHQRRTDELLERAQLSTAAWECGCLVHQAMLRPLARPRVIRLRARWMRRVGAAFGAWACAPAVSRRPPATLPRAAAALGERVRRAHGAAFCARTSVVYARNSCSSTNAWSNCRQPSDGAIPNAASMAALRPHAAS